LIHDIGYTGQGLVSNPAALIMSDEAISYAKKIMGGFDLTREKMGLDVIARVGHGGNYLAEEHTAKHFGEELWKPMYVNRENIETWQKNGEIKYDQVVTKKAIEVLASHKPASISKDVSKEMDRIIKEAEKRLKNHSFIA
jgi:trimethylamine--corrinoid protein Co-methyltransferase